MDFMCIGGLYLDGKGLFFNVNEDELLDDSVEAFMVDSKGSL